MILKIVSHHTKDTETQSIAALRPVVKKTQPHGYMHSKMSILVQVAAEVIS